MYVMQRRTVKDVKYHFKIFLITRATAVNVDTGHGHRHCKSKSSEGRQRDNRKHMSAK